LDGGSASRKAATYTQNKLTETSMPRMGFEPTIPVFERAKTVHASDRAATVIGHMSTSVLTNISNPNISQNLFKDGVSNNKPRVDNLNKILNFSLHEERLVLRPNGS
jgi:hypothetical protein